MEMSTPMQFEDLPVKSKTEETSENHILQVEIPDGFLREHIGAKVEYDFGRVRIYGERQLEDNRRGRFNEVYQVPPYCDISKVKGKFDGKTVTISMVKIPELFQQFQEQQEAEQKAKAQRTEQEPETQQTEEKEDTPPQSANEEVKDQKGQEEGVSDKDSKPEVESKQEDTKNTEESMPPKDQEEVPQKDTITKVESEKQGDQESSTPPEEEVPQKAEVTKDAKLQTEEKIAEPDDETKKKEKIGKEETKELHKEAAGSGKTPESKEESKGSDAAGSLSPKNTEQEKGKETNGKIVSDDAERKIGKAAIPESTTVKTRIKEMADSTSQAVTSLVKRFSDEDKQKLIYMGAAVVVVALGVYASYKLRSSRRP